MSNESLDLFWNLTNTPAYKSEVFKIINEVAFHLKTSHIEYFFNKITATPNDKLSMEEFNALGELGKYCRNPEFMQKVSNFFWKIITEAAYHTDELIENCIKKFTDMVQFWTIDSKWPLLESLIDQLKVVEHPSLPVIRVFKKMIKDQKERVSPSTTVATTSYSHTATYPASSESVYDMGGSNSSQTTTVATTDASDGKQTIETASASKQESRNEKELTFEDILNNLQTEKQLVDTLLQNLTAYCKLVETKVAADASLAKTDRNKLYFYPKKSASHAEEISERLQFLNYYASVSSFIISKVQLKVIYDLLSKSSIKSDLTEFLIWCKQACESSTNTKTILNLEEVGEFYSELIKNGLLDVKTMPLVGFEFLQHYFISVNENQSKLLKQKKEKSKAQTNYSSGATWKSYFIQKNNEEVPVREDNEPSFKIVINPTQLEKSEMIWTVVLNSENEEVIPKAVNFLIKTYLNLDECLSDSAAQIQQDLIEQCMSLITDEKSSAKQVKRVLYILKNIVKESEKRGTGGVQPHNAILKGELLDRIIIKNQTMTKAQNIIVSVYTSATVWEFVSEVSKMLWLTPKHVEFRLPNNRIIDETMHGMVLGQLDFKQGDVITARKINIEEDIPLGQFVDQNRQFTPAAQAIFDEWWEIYKEEGTDEFTTTSAVRFIKGCTHEDVTPDDSRIDSLFKLYDKDKTGKMSRANFMDFFLKACIDRVERVLENFKCHHIRPDLQKIYMVKEESEFNKEQMPRFTMSANQRHFDILMNVLDKNKDAQADAWDLIRMLATNQEMYREVLTLKEAKDEAGMIHWQKFFNNSSVYKQIYNFEIIEAVMNEGDSNEVEEAGDNRVFFIEYQDTGKKKNKAGWLPPQLKDKRELSLQTSEDQQRMQLDQLKNNWTKQFVEQNGIQFVVEQVLSLDFSNPSKNSFQLKNKSFLLTLLRVFIIAAISAQPNQDTSGSVSLLRRKSSIRGDAEDKKEEGTKAQEAHAQLVQLLKGPEGTELLLSLDFYKLQHQVIKLVSSILEQEQISQEDKHIVENAISLWIGIVNYKPDLFQKFTEYQGTSAIAVASDFIMHGVLFCKEEKIRQDFKTALSVLGRHDEALSFLIKILSANFSQISDYPCVQFFELYNELIDLFYVKQSLGKYEESQIFDPEVLLSFIIDKIRSLKQTSGATEEEEDDIFAKEKLELNEKFRIGLIQLLCKIITKVEAHISEKIVKEKDLIKEIFREFLFASFYGHSFQEGSKGPQIKLSEKKKKKATQGSAQNTKSREAAYSLLLLLIKKSPVLMNRFINEQLNPLLEMIKKPNKWNYQPPGQNAALQKYVGLRNLGCICYMNSMMQQFFMTPAFRYNILCVDDGINEDQQEYKGEVFDDNLLHQLQRLVAHLELSERQDYNPKGFCFSFKEFDGQPTNTSEQKDAQEFLNVLFDRLDNALKPTTRKYLLQSIYGGKICSQMVCMECGKVKNRLEDYYNLSLTVKDIKSMYDSLDQQVKGEIITDYFCEQCNRKVSLSKRTLIAETPNILIVHLQRIVFNFDTFRNDKINSMFKFPAVLDLKPYSYYDVMGKEGRLPQKKEVDQETETETEETTKIDEDFIQPIEDDCYEYKLVGVNMHSGSANAGHYWSYINTNRAIDEADDNPNWIKTGDDPWMEFNDSRVTDFQYSKLEEEGFGEEASSSAYSAWSFGGGSYGKSAYMLFYERRKKKGLKILVPEAQVEATKAQGVKVEKDEKTGEHFKIVGYREGAENEKPSDIYAKVFEDNQSVTFENDIYSQEFFDFIKQILEKVASYSDNSETTHELNIVSMSVAKKAVIDILSRCFNNGGMKVMVQIMIDIFKKDDALCRNFVSSLLNENNAECIMEILFECTDKVSQANVARLVKYLLCRLKELEKDDLISGATEVFTETRKGDGEEAIEHKHILPKAICAKFMNVLLYHLKERAARSWARFDNYLEIIKAFGINSAEDIENESDQDSYNLKSDGARIGLEFYFQHNILERLLDFILQDASPLKQPNEKRPTMGSSFITANFTPIVKLITVMMTEQNLLAKYPMTEVTRQMIASKDMLAKMMEPSGNSDSSKEVILMCHNNLSMSKKVAKLLIKGINQYQAEKVTKYLKLLKRFLRLDDQHKLARIEWTLGVPQLIHKKQFREKTYQYGLELVDKINDEAYNFETSLFKGSTSEDALLTQLLKIRKQQESVCMIALKCLLKLCVSDQFICKYVYNCAPPNYQYANYIGWIRPYFQTHRSDLEKAMQSGASSYSNYYENRMTVLIQAEQLLEKFQDICKQYEEEEKAALDTKPENQFVGLRDTWMAWEHEDVIKHWPPQVIVGRQVGEERVILIEENESVAVRLVEVDCEWMFSNPTGLFNLSIPDKAYRTPNYQAMTYEQFKTLIRKQRQQELTEGTEQPSESEEPNVTKDWINNHLVGPVLLRVEVKSKVNFLVNVKVQLNIEDNEFKNVNFSHLPYGENIFANDSHSVAILCKIDPTKDSWGSISLSFKVKTPSSGNSTVVTSSNWGANGTSLRNNIIAAHTGTGFFKATQLNEIRRNGVLIDANIGTIEPQEEQGNTSDKANASNDGDSEKNFNDFQVLNEDEIEPVYCVHCGTMNKGDSLYCCNPTCNKILTQYSYDVTGNLD